MLDNKLPVVEGDGKQSRDFTYVENVVLVNLAAAKAPGVGGEVFNVACGSTYSLLGIIKYLNKFLGAGIKPEFAPPRKGDVRKTIADISKMKKILKISPKVEFEEGLKKTLEWFRGERSKGNPAS